MARRDLIEGHAGVVHLRGQCARASRQRLAGFWSPLSRGHDGKRREVLRHALFGHVEVAHTLNFITEEVDAYR